MRRQRDGKVSSRNGIGVDAPVGEVLPHLHKKGLIGIAPAVQQRLLRVGHIVEQPGITALTGYGKGIVFHPVGGEVSPLAIIKIPREYASGRVVTVWAWAVSAYSLF